MKKDTHSVTPKIKTPISELKRLSGLSVNFLNLTMIPKHDVEKIVATMSAAAVSILGYNPLISYSIPEDTVVNDLNLEVESKFSRMQKIAIPFENYFVEKLLECPKKQIKSERITYISNENVNNDVVEDRILLIGKIENEFVTFQINFRTETSGNGKVVKFSSNLGLLANGKDYMILERYDTTNGHMNMFYNDQKAVTDVQQKKFISSPAHLHYYNKRAMVSVFNAIHQEGYVPEEILTAKIMSKQEATSFRTFKTPLEAKDFFNKKYNIQCVSKRNERTMSFKTIKDVFENNAYSKETEVDDEFFEGLRQLEEKFNKCKTKNKTYQSPQFKPTKKSSKKTTKNKSKNTKNSRKKQQNNKNKIPNDLDFEF